MEISDCIMSGLRLGRRVGGGEDHLLSLSATGSWEGDGTLLVEIIFCLCLRRGVGRGTESWWWRSSSVWDGELWWLHRLGRRAMVEIIFIGISMEITVRTTDSSVGGDHLLECWTSSSYGRVWLGSAGRRRVW